jgi:hypothetical protein
MAELMVVWRDALMAESTVDSMADSMEMHWVESRAFLMALE